MEFQVRKIASAPLTRMHQVFFRTAAGEIARRRSATAVSPISGSTADISAISGSTADISTIGSGGTLTRSPVREPTVCGAVDRLRGLALRVDFLVRLKGFIRRGAGRPVEVRPGRCAGPEDVVETGAGLLGGEDVLLPPSQGRDVAAFRGGVRITHAPPAVHRSGSH